MRNNLLSLSMQGVMGRILFFICQLGTHILLANFLGSSKYGVYQLSISILLICSIFGLFAIPKLALKFIPSYLKNNKLTLLKGLLLWSVKRVFFLSLSLFILMQLFAPFLADDIFVKQELTQVFRNLSYSIICINFVFLFSSWGIALGNVKIENFYQLILQPIILLFLFLIYGMYIDFNFSLNFLAVLYFISWISTFFIILFKEFLPMIKNLNLKDMSAKYEKKEWNSFVLPVISYDIIQKTSQHIGIILAGILLNSSNLGYFSLYARLSNIPNMIVVSFSRVFSKTISSFYNSKQYQRLSIANESLRRFLTFIGLIIICLIVLNSKLILSLFGSEYLIGITSFNIMMIGVFFSFYFGTTDYVLLFSGGERKIMYISILKLLLTITLMYLFVDQWSLLGACIAISLCHVLTKILAAIYINKLIKLKYFTTIPMILYSTILIIIYYKMLHNTIQYSLFSSVIFSIVYLISFFILFKKKIFSTYQEILKYK